MVWYGVWYGIVGMSTQAETQQTSGKHIKTTSHTYMYYNTCSRGTTH